MKSITGFSRREKKKQNFLSLGDDCCFCLLMKAQCRCCCFHWLSNKKKEGNREGKTSNKQTDQSRADRRKVFHCCFSFFSSFFFLTFFLNFVNKEKKRNNWNNQLGNVNGNIFLISSHWNFSVTFDQILFVLF